MVINKFVFGVGEAPKWFNDVCQSGKARVNIDEETEVKTVTLHTPTGIVKANVGDTIIYAKSGLAVVPAEKAKKYGLQKEKGQKPIENVENKEY